MIKKILLLSVLSLLLLSIATAQENSAPKAEKILHQTIIHGDTLRDNYFWLRDKNSPEVINYLYANNAYSDNKMKASSTLQKVLFDEYRSRVKETFDSKPQKNEGYYYYTRNVADKDYPALYRKKDSLIAKEQVVLDLNELSKEFFYFSLQFLSYSPDQSIIAYGVDTKGSLVSTMYFKILDIDSTLKNEKIDSVLSVSWANDNKTIYYTKAEAKTKRSYRLYKHTLGTNPIDDELLYEEPDKTYEIGLKRSSSKKFIIMEASKSQSSEAWYWRADDVRAKPLLFKKREAALLYDINHYEGDEFYIQTNYNALNQQLMKAPINAKSCKEWQVVIPHRRGVLFSGYSLLKNYLIWSEQQNVEQRILIKQRKTNQIDTLKSKITLGSMSFSIEDYDYEKTNEIRYSAENMVTPSEEYNYDLNTKKQTFYDMDSINGKYNPSLYASERVWAKAKDGVMIPITLAYKKGMLKNGNNPLLLSGYGSYGVSSMPDFNQLNISLLDRGFIVATAHIRGGREMGQEWYDDGRMLHKKNTFTDFITCAEHLIAEKYTSTAKLAVEGGSAGGLLMGAVTNMRPDLFKCVIASVPFVDVINTMLDESIPLTTGEFEEWGNPKNKKYYDYMKSYSPYDNVEAKAYPHMLVTAGYNDAQVGYWEPAKWVAKLRELKTDTNMLLFKTVMEGGHGGSSGRYNKLIEQAYRTAFVMQCLGVKENYISLKGKVVDEYNEPVIYANVYLEESKIGTTSNQNGEFELKVKEFNNATLVVQSLTYEKQKIKLGLRTRTQNLVIKMKSENIQMKTVTVVANAVDPALGIIKQAIKKRKENYDRVKSFSSDVYMKSNVKLLEVPKNMPFFLKLVANGEVIDSNDLGLVYLSESSAKYYFEKPDNNKEEMMASKVAGQKQGFSWNRVKDVFFNLYEPTIDLSYYSERPFVSPIAPLASLSYKYKFKGSFYIDNKEVNKIEIIPLRKGDPLFQGYIYITSNDYQIYGADLRATKDAQIQFVDTVNLQQEMVNINNTWVPMQMKIYSHIKVFGFGANDVNMASMSNYNLNRSFPPGFFSNETFKIDRNANRKDSMYWKTTRTIMLTSEEEKHYGKSDSIYQAQHTPHYLDSVSRVRNKITFGKVLLGGYTYSKLNDSISKSLSFDPLLFAFGFNTVEGLYTNFNISYRLFSGSSEEYYLGRDRTYLTTTIRYGFANQNFAPGIQYFKTIDNRTSTSISFKVGRFIEQYNQAEPISKIVNAGYTLFDRLNYMKVLQKDVISITGRKELSNGLYAKANVQFYQREAMVNHTDYSFSDKDKRAYSSNNPSNTYSDAPAFNSHSTLEYGISLRYVIKQKYEMFPNFKNVLESKYPDLYFSFKNAIMTASNNNMSKFNYMYLEAGTGKDINLKLLGELKFDVNAGIFLSTDNMLFADYKHFNGNQTMFLHNPKNLNATGEETRVRLTGFHALNYYQFSTNDKFIEAHAMQNFKGFLIGKVPLLRMIHAYEVAGVNFLYTPNLTYNELYFGLSNILTLLRVDAGKVTSIGGSNDWFLRFGIDMEF